MWPPLNGHAKPPTRADTLERQVPLLAQRWAAKLQGSAEDDSDDWQFLLEELRRFSQEFVHQTNYLTSIQHREQKLKYATHTTHAPLLAHVGLPVA